MQTEFRFAINFSWSNFLKGSRANLLFFLPPFGFKDTFHFRCTFGPCCLCILYVMLPIYVSYFMQKNAVDSNKMMASIRLQQARNNWSHWTTNKAKLNLQYLPKYSKKCSPAMLSMKISPQDMFALISNCSNYLILDNSYKLELVIMMRHHDLPFVADFDRWYTTKGESWPWISSFRSFVRRSGGNDG